MGVRSAKVRPKVPHLGDGACGYVSIDIVSVVVVNAAADGSDDRDEVQIQQVFQKIRVHVHHLADEPELWVKLHAAELKRTSRERMDDKGTNRLKRRRK